MTPKETKRKKENTTSCTSPSEDHAASTKKKKKNTRNGDTSYSPAPPTHFLHTSTEQNYSRKHMTIYTHTLSPHTNAFPRVQREIREEFVQVKNALVPMEHTANLSISSRVIRVNMVHRRGKSHGLTWASVWR
jgi:hypothetical protein